MSDRRSISISRATFDAFAAACAARGVSMSSVVESWVLGTAPRSDAAHSTAALIRAAMGSPRALARGEPRRIARAVGCRVPQVHTVASRWRTEERRKAESVAPRQAPQVSHASRPGTRRRA